MSRNRRSSPPANAGAVAAPVARKRWFRSTPVAIAARVPAPAVSAPRAANWDEPAKTTAELARITHAGVWAAWARTPKLAPNAPTAEATGATEVRIARRDCKIAGEYMAATAVLCSETWLMRH